MLQIATGRVIQLHSTLLKIAFMYIKYNWYFNHSTYQSTELAMVKMRQIWMTILLFNHVHRPVIVSITLVSLLFRLNGKTPSFKLFA